MDISLLTDSNLKIKVQRGDRLFFDRYRYCLRFYLPELSAMRDFHKSDIELKELLDSIEFCLATRRELDAKLSYRAIFWKPNNVDPEMLAAYYYPGNLKDLAEILYQKKDIIKLMISGSLGYVYSTDFDFLKKISKLDYVRHSSFREMIVDRPRGTVKLRTSEHKLRLYLTDMWLTAAEKESIVSFLSNQDDVRLSPALKTWCRSGVLWTQRNYFVDYNTPSFPLALQLINPRLVKKILQIVEVNT